MGEGVAVGVGEGVAVGLAVGGGAGVDVGTTVAVGTGVIAGAGVSVGTAATRGGRGGGSGESPVSAATIIPMKNSAPIAPTIHQRHPQNLDDPPEPEPDERDSERGADLNPGERRLAPPSLHE